MSPAREAAVGKQGFRCSKSIDPSEWGVVTPPQTHREAAIHTYDTHVSGLYGDYCCLVIECCCLVRNTSWLVC